MPHGIQSHLFWLEDASSLHWKKKSSKEIIKVHNLTVTYQIITAITTHTLQAEHSDCNSPVPRHLRQYADVLSVPIILAACRRIYANFRRSVSYKEDHCSTNNIEVTSKFSRSAAAG